MVVGRDEQEHQRLEGPITVGVVFPRGSDTDPLPRSDDHMVLRKRFILRPERMRGEGERQREGWGTSDWLMQRRSKIS
jgi:hypothetical protein